jgi:antimicrobial peptide system SdpA family protein
MQQRTIHQYTWITALHFGLIGGFVALAALAAMPFHTVNLPQNVRSVVLQIAPEGWGFFTKSPRDPETHVALFKNERLHPLNIASSFTAQYAFGFNRLGRAQGIELDALLVQLNQPEQWLKCTQSPEVCATSLKSQMKLENTARHATLCGDLVFVERRPVPWAYSRLARPVVMPSRLTRLEVVCSRA